MSQNFTSGHLTGVKWSPAGGSQILLPVVNHNFKESCNLIDVTNLAMVQIGRTARLAGKNDSEGTCTIVTDVDNMPYLSNIALVPGSLGIFLLFYQNIALNHPFQIPASIESVSYEASTTTAVMTTVTWKENALAGLFVRPSA